MPPSCVVVGALCEDIVRRAGTVRRGIGGTAYYFSAAFSGLGGKPVCVTKTNRAWMVEELRGAGVPVEGVHQGRCCGFELAYAEEGRSLRLFRHSSKIGSEDVPKGLPRDGLHIGPVEEELDPSIWALADSFGHVTLDIQGLARTFDEDGRVGMRDGMTDEISNTLGSIDAVKFSEDEALALLGPASTWDRCAGELIDRGVGSVLVTLGPRGALVFEGGACSQVRSFPSEPIDWTGAGDCLMAGYAYRKLTGSGSIEALEFGSALAACVIEAPRPVAFPSEARVAAKIQSGAVGKH